MARKVDLLLGLALLVLAGCGRDFTLPGAKALSLSPGAPSVAPFEQLPFTAKNGTKPYAFVIATDGSGGATIDAKTGAYQAGPIGPAADVVRVTDASGLSATTRVTVGPKLTVAPQLTLAAPGGQVALTATGGKPPYTASAIENTSGGSFGGTSGLTWTVGSGGEGTDTLEVTDAVGARARALVHVGQALALLPTRAPTVAPRETLAFVATGGQPPYTFSVKTPGSAPTGGAAGDPPSIAASGMYQAGSVGDAIDTVEVTDANGVTADADVTVTAALTAHLDNPELHPAEAVRVVAAGGKPPYAFAFAHRGNRSDGTLDPITGVYTPGWAYEVADVVEVTDSAGVVLDMTLPPVGWEVLPTPEVYDATMDDLNGDRRADAVVSTINPQDTLTYLMPQAAPPIARDYAVLGGAEDLSTRPGLDLDGNGTQDVLHVVGTRLHALEPGLDGAIAADPAILDVMPSLAPTFDAIPTANGASFFRLDPTYSCAGLLRSDWSAGQMQPASPPCIDLPVTEPWRAADVDGDGEPDLVWAHDNQIVVALGPAFSTTTSYTLPGKIVSGVKLAVLRHGAVQNATMDDVLTLVTLANGGTAVTGFSGGAVVPAMVVAKPGDPPPDHILGVHASLLGLDSVVAWSPSSPVLRSARWDPVIGWSADMAAGTLPKLGFDGLAAGDADGDGAADLLAYGVAAEQTLILWGDGGGRYGNRPRVPRPGYWWTVGDLDGDGLDDVLAQDGTRLVVLYGTPFANGERGVAFSAPEQVDEPGSPDALVDFDGDGRAELLYSIHGDGLHDVARDASGAWTVDTKLPVPAAADPAAVDSVGTFDIGGDAPGPDILMETAVDTASGTIYPVTGLLRQTSGIVQVPVPAYPLNPPNGFCFGFPYGADPGGLAGVTASCLDYVSGAGNTMEMYVSRLGTSSGGSPTFGQFQLLVSANGMGIIGPAGQLGATHGFYSLPYAPGAGSTLILVSGSTVTKKTLAYPVFDAILTDLDGDGRADFVLEDRDGDVHVILDAAGGSWTDVVTTHVGSMARLVGPAHLAPGAPVDILVRSPGELTILKNDGGGHLQ